MNIWKYLSSLDHHPIVAVSNTICHNTPTENLKGTEKKIGSFSSPSLSGFFTCPLVAHSAINYTRFRYNPRTPAEESWSSPADISSLEVTFLLLLCAVVSARTWVAHGSLENPTAPKNTQDKNGLLKIFRSVLMNNEYIHINGAQPHTKQWLN